MQDVQNFAKYRHLQNQTEDFTFLNILKIINKHTKFDNKNKDFWIWYAMPESTFMCNKKFFFVTLITFHTQESFRQFSKKVTF